MTSAASQVSPAATTSAAVFASEPHEAEHDGLDHGRGDPQHDRHDHPVEPRRRQPRGSTERRVPEGEDRDDQQHVVHSGSHRGQDSSGDAR